VTEYTWRSRARYRIKRIMDELKDLRHREQHGGRSLSRKQLEHWEAKSRSHLKDKARNGSLVAALEAMVSYASRVRRGSMTATEAMWELDHPEELQERAVARSSEGTQAFIDAFRKLNIGNRVLRPPQPTRDGGMSRSYSEARKAEQRLVLRGVLARADVQLLLQYDQPPPGVTDTEWARFKEAVLEAVSYVGEAQQADAKAMATARTARATAAAGARADERTLMLERLAMVEDIMAASGSSSAPAAAEAPGVSVIAEHPIATAGAALGVVGLAVGIWWWRRRR